MSNLSTGIVDAEIVLSPRAVTGGRPSVKKSVPPRLLAFLRTTRSVIWWVLSRFWRGICTSLRLSAENSGLPKTIVRTVVLLLVIVGVAAGMWWWLPAYWTVLALAIVISLFVIIGCAQLGDQDRRLKKNQADRAGHLVTQAAIRNQIMVEQLVNLRNGETAEGQTWAPFQVTKPFPLLRGPVSADTVPIGQTRDGKVEVVPAEESHILVAGASGSGKSVMIRTLVVGWRQLDATVYLFSAKAPTSKADDFSVVRDGVAKYAVGPDAVEVVADTLGQLARNLDKLTGRTLVVIDEVTDFLQDPEHGARVKAALESLARRSRSAGLTLVLGVQSPTKDGLPPQVKRNMMVTIAMRTRAEEDVRYLAGQDAKAMGLVCHKWVPKVDAGMAWVLGLESSFGEPILIRGWFVDDDAAQKAIDAVPTTVRGEIEGGAKVLPFRSSEPIEQAPVPCAGCGEPLAESRIERGSVHCGADVCRQRVSRQRRRGAAEG